ncbi:hypothetical protein N658DRAFT_507863 [Parathielavia hyrcaniae]|uniref:Uncharacterized protein n=1 Tax=Parathielavia hyrcaniae TaxID=113614 RepID=A0AAN6PYU2_9PEZI|nr:hypothetical protein N658DRAFT_507863 [Parathielavia hyrcaniae]
MLVAVHSHLQLASERDAPTAPARLDSPLAYEAATSSPAAAGITNEDKASDKGQGGLQTWQPKESIIDAYFLHSRPGWETVVFMLLPDLSTAEYREASWAATLLILCDDLSRLMREGIFWSPDNLVPEQGPPSAHNITNGGENPRWVGKLNVAARHSQTLAAFRLQNLSPQNASHVYAKNRHGRMVYNYFRGWPEANYNYIYGDKPLQVAARGAPTTTSHAHASNPPPLNNPPTLRQPRRRRQLTDVNVEAPTTNPTHTSTPRPSPQPAAASSPTSTWKLKP